MQIAREPDSPEQPRTHARGPIKGKEKAAMQPELSKNLRSSSIAIIVVAFSSFFYALQSPDRHPCHVATPRQRNISHEHHDTRSTDEDTKLGPDNGVGLHLIAVARVGVATSFRFLATTEAIARDA